jgi:hypothetical protein
MKREHAFLGVALGVLVAAVLVFWLILDDSGSDDSGKPAETTASIPAEAEVVSVDSLTETVGGQGTPIYWAGPPQEAELELSRPEESRTYVRYLTGGAEAGDPRPFLTVGSYEIDDPASALRRQGNRADGVVASAPEGGVVYFNRSEPKSVYLAYPGVDVQVEVFAPDFEQALQLVTGGQIVPVE